MISEKLLDRAARYLAYKPRTSRQLRSYLAEHGAGEEEAEECVKMMEEYHLLDDLEYSRSYIDTKAREGHGMNRIRRELAQKGVPASVIEDALAEIDDLPEEEETALAQALAAVEGVDILNMEYPDKQKLMGRIAGRLSRRGFSAETVYRSVRTAFARREEEQRG